MDHADLEGGLQKRTNFRRKWHQIPRLFRIYIVIGILFLLAYLFSYTYFVSKELPNAAKHVDDSAQINTAANNNYFTASNYNIKIPQVVPESKRTDAISPQSVTKLLTLADFKEASLKQNDIQKRIQDAISYSWKAYRRYSWGSDHLKPISKSGHNWFRIGLTILDSLDTLLIAGLVHEYEEGLEWIKNDLNFDIYQDVNCFETTIRALGGLISAYHITKERVLLEKADDLGNRLIQCFESPSRTVPFSDVNLKTKVPKAPRWSSDSSLSEVSSMQLEFRDLTYETKNQNFERKSFATSKHIHELVSNRGDPLLPMYISPISGHLSPGVITMGARADSYYEYLLKQYLQTKFDFLLEDYIYSVEKIEKRLLRYTKGQLKLAYIGEIFPSNKDNISPKMDHLVCFFSGTLALGYYQKEIEKYPAHIRNANEETFERHLKIAEDLARTCHYMYNLTETGLSPEIGYFGMNEEDKEYTIRPADTHNLLRPEFVESLFFLYHITGKQIYRDWGLQVFNAFEKYSRVSSGGYTTINDVRNPSNVKPRDMMESFWLAETLKYLYLLFSDDRTIINSLLTNYIFNTEGHLVLKRNK